MTAAGDGVRRKDRRRPRAMDGQRQLTFGDGGASRGHDALPPPATEDQPSFVLPAIDGSDCRLRSMMREAA
jgi:hypothetical protein